MTYTDYLDFLPMVPSLRFRRHILPLPDPNLCARALRYPIGTLGYVLQSTSRSEHLNFGPSGPAGPVADWMGNR